MNIYVILISELLAGVVIVVLFARAVWRSEARTEARLRQLEEAKRVEVAEAEAEVAKVKAKLPKELVLHLNLSDEDALPDLPAATEQAQPLVSALSRHEQSLGGAGLTLTAAKVEPGAVRLTLSPVERSGSGERVQRVIEELNATRIPLPPGVTAAHATALAL